MRSVWWARRRRPSMSRFSTLSFGC
jgi:hypothetical protein